MSLKIKFALLFAGFLLALGSAFLIHMHASLGVAEQIGHVESVAFPQHTHADALLTTFDKIQNLFEIALLTGELGLLESCDGGRDDFLRELHRLRDIARADPEEEKKLSIVEEGFGEYFEGSRNLVAALVESERNIEGRSEPGGRTFEAESAAVAEVRARLRDRLAAVVSERNEHLSGTLTRISRDSREQLNWSLVVGAVAAALMVGFLAYLARAIIGPVTALSAMTSDVARGAFDRIRGIPHLGHDEVGMLAESFVRMTHSLKETTISRDFFDKIIQSMADILIVTRPDLTIAIVNEAACEDLGFTTEELTGRSIAAVLDSAWFAGSRLQSPQADTGIYDHAETWLVGRGGRRLPVLFSCSGILDSEGELQWLVCVASDITARKQAEEAMRRAEKSAREQQQLQADKMATLSILVSGVAHEINNPNHVIASNVAYLRKSWSSALPIFEAYHAEHGDFALGGISYTRAREYVPTALSIIQGGSERIRNIVKELRDYARLQPTDLDGSVDVNAVVKSAVTLMGNMLGKATSSLVVDLDGAAPSITGNYQRLEQVLINLIANACQALRDKSESIRIATQYDAEADSIVLTVADEGVGMSEETLRHAADPFFTTKRDSGGTGLGLSISAKIVSEHGGRLELESGEGGGALVRVTLPAGGRDDNEDTGRTQNE